MDYKKMAEEIVEKLGGESNIINAAHCVTRLRINLRNKDMVNLDNLKRINGVVGTQYKNEQLQIIIGPQVTEVFKALPTSIEKESAMVADDKDKGSIIDRAISTFSAFFFPISMVLGGAGLIKGILSLLVNYAGLAETAETYVVFNMIADGLFYFLPFFLAVTIAKKLNVNTYMAMAMAALLMYPTLIEGAASGTEPLRLFGMISVPQISYATSVIPIIFSVITMKYVFNFLDRIIPKSLQLIVTSALALVVTGILTVTIYGPLGTYAGNVLSNVISSFYTVAGPLASTLMGFLMVFLTITGMGYSFYPVVFFNLATFGFDFLMIPIIVFTNINQGVASLAVGLKTRSGKIRALALSTGLTAIMGITEPAMYSINLRFKKPFYCTVIANTVVGLLAGLFKVKTFALAGGGITGIAGFPSVEYPQNFLCAMICLLAGVVLTFVLTYIFTPADILVDEET